MSRNGENISMSETRRFDRTTVTEPKLLNIVKARTTSPIAFLHCNFQAGFITLVMIILLYMAVSMSLTLFDKWIVTDFGFNAPLTMVMCTYLFMHLFTTVIRWRIRPRGLQLDGHPMVQDLTRSQWLWKVAPVAAAAGLEVGTSLVGLQAMQVGFHTMVRATVPIFVLVFAIVLRLETMRIGLVAVVVMVSMGVVLLSSGEHQQLQSFPVVGFGLTLLSAVLAGLKWTLSQVLVQGRALRWVSGPAAMKEQINPLALLHYMSLASAATLVPFACALESRKLRRMGSDFKLQWLIQVLVLCLAVSLLASLLALLEFSFIKRLSSLSLCIIGVVKELVLVMFSVVLMGETLSGRTVLGFGITMLGVSLYKVVPKGPPPGDDDEPTVVRADPDTPNQRFVIGGTSSSSDDPGSAGNANGLDSPYNAERRVYLFDPLPSVDASHGETLLEDDVCEMGVQASVHSKHHSPNSKTGALQIHLRLGKKGGYAPLGDDT